jgi:hypothetical protein
VQPYSTTLLGPLGELWGTLSPPHISRRWDRQLSDKPETEIRDKFGKPIQDGLSGLQRSPNAKLPRPKIQSSETIVTAQP